MSLTIGVVSLFPEMLRAWAATSIPGRAQQRGLLRIECWNPRDYALDRHRSVDDRPYGGGPGMVMKVEPARSAVRAAREAVGGPVIYLSPQGARLDQGRVRTLAESPGFVLLAGRYEGVDERLIELEVDEELSVGDFVLSGGEPAALLIIDAVARLLPGALGDARSAQEDSFADGLLDYPHYTRPETVEGLRVPETLMSGDHGEIERWRRQQAMSRTWRRRPDLLTQRELSAEQRDLLERIRQQEEGLPESESPDGDLESQDSRGGS